jgi:hypothetical protein
MEASGPELSSFGVSMYISIMSCNKNFMVFMCLLLNLILTNNTIMLMHDLCVHDLSVRSLIPNANSDDNTRTKFWVLNKTWLICSLE